MNYVQNNILKTKERCIKTLNWKVKWEFFSEREDTDFLKSQMLPEMEKVRLEKHLSMTDLEACQTSKLEQLAKIVNALKALTIFAKKAQYDGVLNPRLIYYAFRIG